MGTTIVEMLRSRTVNRASDLIYTFLDSFGDEAAWEGGLQ